MLSLLLKSPSVPLYERGMTMDSPLWQRGVRGDFVKNFNSIGVLSSPLMGEDFVVSSVRTIEVGVRIN